MAQDGAPALSPGDIPARKPTVETLSQRQRVARRNEGPRTRLTQALTDDICATLRTGAHPTFAADFAGVSPSTVSKWMRTAGEAEAKRAEHRTQYERRCLIFREAVRKAQAEAGLRTHHVIADAAGITRNRPVRRKTRQEIMGGEVDERGNVSGGTVVRVTVEHEELAPDWHAAAHLGKVRFPEQMGGSEPPPDDDRPAAPINGKALHDRFQQILRDRAEAGLDDSDVIEATATVHPPENPPPR